MRTPIWETSAGALYALLNSAVPLIKADLYTLTLGNGTVYRWSGADIQVTGNGNTWTLGPGLDRTKVRWTVGVPVDDMVVTLTDVATTTFNGQSLMAFIRAGGLLGARLQVDKAFWALGDTAARGAFLWFAGRVAEVDGDRFSATLTVRSDLELLDVQVPSAMYQAPCLNTVYDSACGLARATFTVTNAASTDTDTPRLSFNHTLSQAAGYFDLGTITMTSGANAGISRTVRTQTGTKITVLNPWPFIVHSGDTFSAVPGCDGLQTTCTTKYSNVIRFRGQPNIPTPETVT